MIKIAVLDDEEAARNRMEAILARYAAEHDKQIEWKSYLSFLELKWDLVDKKAYYDIYLLDIELGEENGLLAAQFVREL